MVNIEIGPNLLAAAPWLFLATAIAALATVNAVSSLCANSHRLAEAIATIIEAWRNK